MASQELKILISAVNDSKGVMQEVLKGLSEITGHVKALQDSMGQDPISDTLKEQSESLKATEENVLSMTDGVQALNAALSTGAKALKFLAGGFLALKSVQFVKDLADTAARTETLGIVLNQVGQNAGYTRAEVAAADQAVQKLGITASAARQSLTALIQAEIPLNFAEPLARAAQDLAVVSGQNSSETLSRLITNIQQMDTMGLRFMGILIDKEKVFQQAAQETGKAITGNAQKIVFANAALAEAAKLTGIYESSMESAGKQLTSMPRYIENLKVSLGNNLLPVYLQLIRASTEVIKVVGALSAAFSNTTTTSKIFGNTMVSTQGGLSSVADGIASVVDALKDLHSWINKNKETIQELGKVLLAVGVGIAGGTAAWGLYRFAIIAVQAATKVKAALLLLPPALAAVRTAMLATGASMLAAAGPWGLAAAALTVVATAAWYAYQRYKEAQEGMKSGPSDPGAAAVVPFEQALKAQTDALTRLIDTQEALRKARNLVATAQTAAEIATAKEAEKAAQKAADEATEELQEKDRELKKAEKLIREAEQEGRLSPAQISSISRQLEDKAKRTQAVLDAQQALENLRSALQEAGVDVSLFENGVTTSFNNIKTGIGVGLSSIVAGAEGASQQFNVLMETYQQLAGKVTNQKELQQFGAMGDELVGKARELGKDVGNAVAEARKVAAENVTSNEINVASGGAEALAKYRQQQKAMDDARIASMRISNTMAREMGELQLQEEQDRYDRGLMSFEAYYAKRLEVLRSNAAAEQAELMATVAALQSQYNRADPKDQADIARQIDQAQMQLNAANQRSRLDERRLDLERISAARDLRREINQLALDIRSMSGDDIQNDVAALSLQYEEMAQKLGKSAEGVALLRKKWELDVVVLYLEKMNDQLQRQLSLQQSLIDLKDSEINLLQKNGQLSGTQAEAQRNALIQQRVFLKEQELAAEEESLRVAIQRLGKDSDQANASRENINRLKADLNDLQAQMHTVGDSIRDIFTDSVSRGLEDGLNGVKDWKDAVTGIFDDFKKGINRIIAKEASERLTAFLVESTGGKDNSIFATMGKVIQPGEDASKPLFVTDASKDPTAQAPTGSADDPLNVLVQNMPEALKGGSSGAGSKEADPLPTTDRLQSIAEHAATTAKDTTGLREAFEVLLKRESNGKQFDSNGNPLTSKKGAIGIAQVMPGTAPEAAKLAGVPFDENKYRTDPEYNAQLGFAYFQKQFEDFGSLTKAFAAYNAGPGAVRKAEREGGDSPYGWLEQLPKETQAYVRNNMSELSARQAADPDKPLKLARNSVGDAMHVYDVTPANDMSTAQGKMAGEIHALLEQNGQKMALEEQARYANSQKQAPQTGTTTQAPTDKPASPEGQPPQKEFNFFDSFGPLIGSQLGSANGGGYMGMGPLLGVELMRRGGPINTLFDAGKDLFSSAFGGDAEGVKKDAKGGSPGDPLYILDANDARAKRENILTTGAGANIGQPLYAEVTNQPPPPMQTASSSGASGGGGGGGGSMPSGGASSGGSAPSGSGSEWDSLFGSSSSDSSSGGGFWDSAKSWWDSVDIPFFATGGMVSGPGTGTSDSIPAMIDGVQPAAISAGEFIMPADKTKTYLPLLESIRQGRGVVGYSGGGLAGYFGGQIMGAMGLGPLARFLGDGQNNEAFYAEEGTPSWLDPFGRMVNPSTPSKPFDSEYSEGAANNAFAMTDETARKAAQSDWGFASGGEVPKPGLSDKAKKKRLQGRQAMMGMGLTGLLAAFLDPKKEKEAMGDDKGGLTALARRLFEDSQLPRNQIPDPSAQERIQQYKLDELMKSAPEGALRPYEPTLPAPVTGIKLPPLPPGPQDPTKPTGIDWAKGLDGLANQMWKLGPNGILLGTAMKLGAKGIRWWRENEKQNIIDTEKARRAAEKSDIGPAQGAKLSPTSNPDVKITPIQNQDSWKDFHTWELKPIAPTDPNAVPLVQPQDKNPWEPISLDQTPPIIDPQVGDPNQFGMYDSGWNNFQLYNGWGNDSANYWGYGGNDYGGYGGESYSGGGYADYSDTTGYYPSGGDGHGFADGGLFRGAGTETSDSNQINVSDHEYITKASQTKKWLPLLDAINSGALDKHTANLKLPNPGRSSYAEGGEVVGSNSVVASSVGNQVGKQLEASDKRKSKQSQQMSISVHPDALHMTMQNWLEGEFGRILATR